MKKYALVVLTNSTEGRDDEFNEWYDSDHLPQILGVPGIISAQRYRKSDSQIDAKHFAYYTRYVVETDNPQGVLDEMMGRMASGKIGLSESMSPEFFATLYEEQGGEILSK